MASIAAGHFHETDTLPGYYPESDSYKASLMRAITSDFLAANPLRLANDFMAMFITNRRYAIANLRVDLMYMNERQIRQWMDCLGELMVAEEYPPEMWLAILEAVESLESDVCSRAA